MNHTLFRAGAKAALAALTLAAVFLASSGLSGAARAQSGVTIIRDTEIEGDLKEWAAPVISAAGLEQDGVHIVLVQSPEINAFVAGGPNIFIYSGLLLKSDGPEEVVGVLAHELGHISGGHLVRAQAALDHASYESILGTLLGIGAAIATGEGGAAAAISAGASTMAARRFMAFSRVQESSADQAALSFLQKAGEDPTGLLSFMKKLQDEDLLPADQQTEYTRTHPLTRNRIDALVSGARGSPFIGKSLPPEWKEQHARMKAKLLAFISPEQVAWAYGESDTSVSARYARAIGAWRLNDMKPALSLMDGLLAQEKDNPYFLELKAQMLVGSGQLAQAVPLYERALSLRPGADLIRIDLAHALIESGGTDPKKLDQAVGHLLRARQGEERSSQIYRLLATAYGRMGREPEAQLALAEEALLQRRFDYAKELAERAARGLPEKSREWLRAKDILVFIEQEKNAG